jgi:hypothetical protein
MVPIDDMREEMELALRSRAEEGRLQEMSEFLEEKRRAGVATRNDYALPRIGTSYMPLNRSASQGRAASRGKAVDQAP